MRCRGQVMPDVAAAHLRGLRRGGDRRPVPDVYRRSPLHRRRPQGLPRAARRPAPRARLAARGLAAPAAAPAAAAIPAHRAVAAPAARRPRRLGSSRARGRARGLRLRLRLAARLRLGQAPRRPSGRCTRASTAPRTVARLPGPPYHFMSRITRIDGAAMGVASRRDRRGRVRRPRRRLVLRARTASAPCRSACSMEAALQPCGWLAQLRRQRARQPTKTSSSATSTATATLLAEVLPDRGNAAHPGRAHRRLAPAGMIIESFEVECFLGGDAASTRTNTVFGFFPTKAFENQVGLPPSPPNARAWPSRRTCPCRSHPRPARYFAARRGSRAHRC